LDSIINSGFRGSFMDYHGHNNGSEKIKKSPRNKEMSEISTQTEIILKKDREIQVTIGITIEEGIQTEYSRFCSSSETQTLIKEIREFGTNVEKIILAEKEIQTGAETHSREYSISANLEGLPKVVMDSDIKIEEQLLLANMSPKEIFFYYVFFIQFIKIDIMQFKIRISKL